SVGIGYLPDADQFGDVGSNTLGHIAQQIPGFSLPNLQALGLGNIHPDVHLPAVDQPQAAYGRAVEVSPGKDTTTGHFEIAGVIVKDPFPTFDQHGFPAELMDAFHDQIGVESLGNYAASGTVIIHDLGDEHVATGKPIVYTSADSVFQIAAHEDVIPIERLYEICEIARELCSGDYAVGRVIARPFVGSNGNYTRTANRRDFSRQPPGRTVLRSAMEAGHKVKAVGKMKDIYAGDGVTDYVKTANNHEGVDRTIEYLAEPDGGLIITNLVDFDMHFGHRRDLPGYGNCLQEFDARLPEILDALRDDDVLIITADHGNDPSFPGTDHTREYVPVLVVGKAVENAPIETLNSFADIGATMAHMLNLEATPSGKSFLPKIQASPVQL
ncbi:UNVERIFIED_CONTAM: hypothetical protein GTU68_051189, partial [Idotea baltica]|nr:hypothetical protein [Idotea baltica]